MALCYFLSGDHFIFIGYAGGLMAVLFANDVRLILDFSCAIHFGKGYESLSAEVQAFL